MVKKFKKMMSILLVVFMLSTTLVEAVFAGGPVTVGGKTYIPNDEYTYLVSVATGKAIQVSGAPAAAITADAEIEGNEGNALPDIALFELMKSGDDATVVSFSNIGSSGRMLKSDGGASIIHNNQPKKTTVDGWESFKLHDLGDGTVAISCLVQRVGHYWTVGTGNQIEIHTAETNPTLATLTNAEKFILVESQYAPQPDVNAEVWIEHKATGNMVTVDGVNTNPIAVNTPKPTNLDDVCKFTVRYGFFNNWTINFESHTTTKTIWFANGGGANQFVGGMGGWESVTMEPQGDGTVAFKENQNGTYIRVTDGALRPATGALTENDKFIIHTNAAPKKVNKVTFGNVDRTSIAMSWTAVQNTVFTGYEVWRSDSENGVYTKVRDESTSTEFTDTNLEYGTTYYYAVYTVNGTNPRSEGGISSIATQGVDDLKDALDTVIAGCAGIVQGDYTEASWTGFAAALANATTVKGAAKPSVADLENAASALSTAKAALVTKVAEAKSALSAVITNDEKLVEADYTAESWTGFASALTSAKASVGNAAATVADLTAATTALDTARGALVTKVSVAKENLSDKITEYELLVEAEYTTESWAGFASALASAKATVANNASTLAKLEEDLSALNTAKDTLITKITVAKQDLSDEITACDEQKETDYTAESWTGFASALASAKATVANNASTLVELEVALTALTTAKDALVTKAFTVAKAGLETALKDATALKQADYTAESWKAFVAALKATEELLKSANPTVAELEKAQTALNAAKVALVTKPVPSIKLAAPKSVKAVQAGPKKVKVTWAKVTGAKKYDVYRSNKKNSAYKKVKTVTAASYTDKKATAGKTWYYKIVAVGATAVENSVQSSAAKIAVLKAPKLSKVMAQGNGKVKVTWGKKVSGASGYQILVSTSKKGKYKAVKQTIKKNKKAATIKLKKGKTYYVKVRAIKKVNGKNVAGQLSGWKKVVVK